MADSRRVSKLPRAVLAKMTDNNPQAIRAFENIETAVIETNPKDIADLIIRINGVTDQAEQATIIATQLTAIAQQLIADIRPTLNAVNVPSEPSDHLQAVNVSIYQDDYLQAVSGHCDYQNQLIPVGNI